MTESTNTFPFWQRLWPVVWRELRMTARRRSTFVVRFLFSGALLAMAIFIWVNLVRKGVLNSTLDHRALSVLGWQIFNAINGVGTLALATLSPAFTAGAVTEEKERQTLGLIQTTYLGAREMILGKAMARLGSLILLITAGLPVLASCLLFGGVGPRDLLKVAVGFYGLALLGASVGFLFSVLCARSYLALIWSYAAFAVYFVAISLIPWNSRLMARLIMSVGGGVPEAAKRLWNGASFRYYPTAVGSSLFAGIPFFLVSLLLFGVAFWLFPRFADRSPSLFWRRLFLRADRTLERLNRGLWAYRFRSDELTGNPVAWKERHFQVLGKIDHLIRAGCLVAAPLLGGYLLLAWIHPDWLAGKSPLIFLTGLMALSYLFISISASTSMTIEKERSTWPLLLSSFLSGGDIVLGKCVGVACACVLPAILPLIVLFLYVFLLLLHPDAFKAAGLFLAGALLQMAVGLYWSARCRKSMTAVFWTIGFGLALHLLGPVFLSHLLGNYRVFVASPFTALFRANHLTSWAWIGGRNYSPWHFVNLDRIAFTIMLAGSILLLFWLAKRFDRITGRSS